MWPVWQKKKTNRNHFLKGASEMLEPHLIQGRGSSENGYASLQVSLLFSLWVETVRPYLQTVDEWIVHGHLCDSAREFIIQR